MKRKLISYEVFSEMKDNSLNTAVKELIEAEEHLARALNVDSLKFNSFDASKVIYEQTDGSFLQAEFRIEKNKIYFENVETLVIDEETVKETNKSILRNMLEALLDKNDAEASKLFEKHIELTSEHYNRNVKEEQLEEARARLYGSKERTGGKSTPKLSVVPDTKDPKRSQAAKAGHRKHKSSYVRGAAKRHRNLPAERSRRKRYAPVHNRLRALTGGRAYNKKKTMSEWATLVNNINQYVEYKENGHVISESKIFENNDTTTITIPTTQARNEGKVLKMHYDNMLKTDVKVLRESARRLDQNAAFCQMIADIRSANNLSNHLDLEEAVTKIVTKFPSVLYLTQNELVKTTAIALEMAGVINYDDKTCTFIAEAISRNAFEYYTDRVQRIVKLASKELTESEDKYLEFQDIIIEFFDMIDQTEKNEMRIYEDLYQATLNVRKVALESNNEVVRDTAQEFAVELENVINGNLIPTFDLALDVANWLEDIVEANMASDSGFEYTKSPHNTENGDHPLMSKHSRVPGTPISNDGGWPDPVPQIGADSMSKDHGAEGRGRSWGNIANKNTWPDVTNPNVLPAPDVYKIKGEKSIEDDNDSLGTWQSSNTWPNETNPYILPMINIKADPTIEKSGLNDDR